MALTTDSRENQRRTILVQSQYDDRSTDDVLDWIFYLAPDLKVARVNNQSYVQRFSCHIHKRTRWRIGVEDDTIDSRQLSGYWYRRGAWGWPLPGSGLSGIERFLAGEHAMLSEWLDNRLGAMPASINRFQDNALNKLEVLSLAAELDINIPETLVTNDPEEVAAFQQRHSRVITKAIHSGEYVFRAGTGATAPYVRLFCSTILLDTEVLDEIEKGEAGMLPALFQVYIEKKIELRIFFLDDVLYAMAIFSQADPETRTDFRHYNMARPNRCMPYRLPEATAQKIQVLMHRLNMRSGSIDMILTPEDEYVFLEVNPVGQFQWVAEHCNYPINQKIAEYLIMNAYDGASPERNKEMDKGKQGQSSGDD